jgi:hypothetical protein
MSKDEWVAQKVSFVQPHHPRRSLFKYFRSPYPFGDIYNSVMAENLGFLPTNERMPRQLKA